ncbi:tigger transposable element-derived protein 6-like [Branchiostoma floridae]|uniref:Tigger transposable element-derived protein 6-like n=1 Tax=Branchiostoma floridae TaxID=7739 RepID=A0A9J7N2E2_BRAFL|nr:tigger transposable element-derived protein 6-like [Branchiostoma floridae]
MDLQQPLSVNGLGTTPIKSNVKAYKTYSDAQMQEAISAVKEGLTPNKASKLFKVPRKTLTDKLKGSHPLAHGGQTVLSKGDELALESYVAQMAEWGHPISVRILKALAGEIHERECKKSDAAPRFRETKATGRLVAGRKWWRSFKKRHPTITHRAQDPLSRERAKMSNQDVIDAFFKLYTDILDKNNLRSKPHLIHNCDETGISMEINRGRVLVPKGVRGVPSRSSGTKDRVTFHLAITAEGKALAPMIIYKQSFPSGAYAQKGPDNCLYAVSESGFTDKDLFEKWFCNHYIRHIPKERPVLLTMDQCEAHLSVKTIETAMKENVILLGLPPHTSHFLQPLDKTCFSSLKDTLGNIVQGLIFENAQFQLSKRNISRVLNSAFEKAFTIPTVKKGFQATGLYPVNPDVVPKRWLTVGEVANQETPTPKESEDQTCQPCGAQGCQTCGPRRAHSLVGRLVPEELADLLVPPLLPQKKTRVSKEIKKARVFTTQAVLEEQMEKKRKREERLAKKKTGTSANAKRQKKTEDTEERTTKGEAEEKVPEDRGEAEERRSAHRMTSANAAAKRQKKTEDTVEKTRKGEAEEKVPEDRGKAEERRSAHRRLCRPPSYLKDYNITCL